MTKPIISIVVCTYNRSTLLKQCLESLCFQTLPDDNFEVIIVDNNSTDDTKKTASAVTEKYSNFRYVIESNLGLSYCRNRGIKEAKGEYVAFIDDDARAAADWAEKIVASFSDVTPVPSVVGGVILPFYDTDPPRWFKDEYETRSWGEEPKMLEPPEAEYGFSGSNCVVKKDILNEYSGFNTDLGMKGRKLQLGEESDLFSRVYRKYPFFWYDPSIKVYHYAPSWKLKKSYQFRRSFMAGKSAANIHAADVSFVFLMRKVWELIHYSAKSVYAVIIDTNPRTDVLFRKTRAVCHRAGGVVESIKILLKKSFVKK